VPEKNNDGEEEETIFYEQLPDFSSFKALRTLHIDIDFLMGETEYMCHNYKLDDFNSNYFPFTLENLKISGHFRSHMDQSAIRHVFSNLKEISKEKNMEHPNLRAICVASLIDGWIDLEKHPDPYKRSMAKLLERDARGVRKGRHTFHRSHTPIRGRF